MKFEVLPGLPAVGPYPDQFAPEGRPTHSEGFVVRFILGDGSSWVGNFQRCLSRFDVVVPHPNEVDLLVIAGGQAYVIDATSRKRKNVFGGAIVGAHVVAERSLVILNHQNIAFEAIGVAGRAWESPRLSWDGFKEVLVDSEKIRGLAWKWDDTWHKFEIDVATGRSLGGSIQQDDDRVV